MAYCTLVSVFDWRGMCVSRHAIQPFVSVSARACRLHQRFAVFIGLPLTYWPLCYAPSCRNVVTECSWGRLTVMPGRIQRMPPTSARLSCSPFCSSALTRRIGAAVFILSRIKERSSAKRRMCALLWHQFVSKCACPSCCATLLPSSRVSDAAHPYGE